MCEKCKSSDGAVRSAYPDEQEKLENQFMIELELMMKIADLLELYSYDLEAKMEDGMPEIQLIQRH